MRTTDRWEALLVVLCAILLAASAGAPAQTEETPESAEHAYFFPRPAGEGNVLQVIGISSAKLPEDVVETDDVFRAPLFGYNLKYGLPQSFNLEAGVATNIVTFHFSAGPSWNFRSGRWGFAAGTDLAYWFGQLKQFGFDTKVHGWTMYPNISVGYAFDPFTITAKGEAVLDLSRTSVNGENQLDDEPAFYNGFALGFYLEQPLWKHHYVVLGTRVTYLHYYYPMWAAFSTFTRPYTIPEFTFRFIL